MCVCVCVCVSVCVCVCVSARTWVGLDTCECCGLELYCWHMGCAVTAMINTSAIARADDSTRANLFGPGYGLSIATMCYISGKGVTSSYFAHRQKVLIW